MPPPPLLVLLLILLLFLPTPTSSDDSYDLYDDDDDDSSYGTSTFNYDELLSEIMDEDGEVKAGAEATLKENGMAMLSQMLKNINADSVNTYIDEDSGAPTMDIRDEQTRRLRAEYPDMPLPNNPGKGNGTPQPDKFKRGTDAKWRQDFEDEEKFGRTGEEGVIDETMTTVNVVPVKPVEPQRPPTIDEIAYAIMDTIVEQLNTAGLRKKKTTHVHLTDPFNDFDEAAAQIRGYDVTSDLYEQFVSSLHASLLQSLGPILDTHVHLPIAAGAMESIAHGADEGGDFKLVKRTQGADGEFYSGSPSEFPLPGLSRSDSAKLFVKKGFSLVVNKMQRRHRGLFDLCSLLSTIYSRTNMATVTANMYLTPNPDGIAAAQGFETHFDWMDVLVVHVSDTPKTWRVYDKILVHRPLRSMKYKPSAKQVENVGEVHGFRDYTLTRGDVLYIKAGVLHEAFVPPPPASSSPPAGDAMHITFGIERTADMMVGGSMKHFYTREWGGKSLKIDDCVERILKGSPKMRLPIQTVKGAAAIARGGRGNAGGEGWSEFREALRSVKRMCKGMHDVDEFYDYVEDEKDFFVRNVEALRRVKEELVEKERLRWREWDKEVDVVWEEGNGLGEL